jgi:hypothetical protein
MMARTPVALIFVAGLGVGCALHPAPTEQLAISEQAIAAARLAGAGPAELRLAQDKLELGRRWIAARDYEPARWLVEQAQVDAELAGLKAMSLRARAQAARETQEFRARNALLAGRAP